ncbi:MAG: hypothetical protein Q9217_005642 [Psora testacea]
MNTAAASGFLVTLVIVVNVLQQILFKDPNKPPVVFHLLPIIGSTVTYGMDPFKFFFDSQAKYGDVYTFILLGRKVTVYLGKKGNQFILNGKLKDVNAEEIYAVLTTPVFGKDVIYDVPNAKFMEQKKFIKFGLTSDALRSYVPLMEDEVCSFIKRTPHFKGSKGTVNIPPIMAQITIFTASRSLQGREVRQKLDSTFAGLYHALDDGFQPINFMLPWFPLPQNRKRDMAQRTMSKIYTDIIKERRRKGEQKDSEDMIWNLMRCVYKDGTPIPDTEIAHLMIALLMAGQHSSSVTSSWIVLHLAAQPQIMEELYQEQLRVLGDPSTPLTYEKIQNLPFLMHVIRETLRLHPPIHTIMRKVKTPLPIEGTRWIIPPSHVLLAAPATMGKSDDYFPNADKWDPHRWEDMADPENDEKEKTDYGYGVVSTGADSTYLPFGAGRHRCIGEHFAYVQLTIVVSVMVREFQLRNVERKTGVVGTDYSAPVAMSKDHQPDDGSAESSFSPSMDHPSDRSLGPKYMTVGDGSTSASAAALMATLDHDSGYGGSISHGDSDDGRKGWHPGLTVDRYTPADTPGATDPENEKRVMASYVHQLYYNQNRAALGRQITRTIDTLEALRQMNATWPAQYPSVREPQNPRPDPRPGVSHTQSSAGGANIYRQVDNIPLRPGALRRAATSLEEGSSAGSSSSAEQKGMKEPERLITPQSAQDFSVLKLSMNVQGFTQAEIAHSMKKESVASLLDGKINQTIRHLLLLRDRIEDTSSKVLVTGDLNAGKSTFCNALLRRKILPEDQQPCTSIFCEVLDAKENGNLEEAHAVPKGAIYDRNDESTYDVYQLHDLEKVVSDNEQYTQCKVYVKDIRTIDESLLNNGVVDISIIDAPGLNSDSLKTTAVFARQEEIDVVVFVVSAANHFTLSAKDFIWNAAHEKAYIFIVVNGFDNIRDKARCERTILEQVANLSPRTFKESAELVHFVSSNAVPVAPAIGPSGGGSGCGSGPSDDGPSPDNDDEAPLGKHGEPGSPPDKGKGKDKEKIQDFEELESSLRRFVLEKRARSKLAPAKTYLLNVLADLHLLATVNRDIAQSELDRVVKELDEIEPAFEKSKKARTEVSDDVDKTIEETCSNIYKDTRTVLSNAISTVAEADLGVPYPGLMSAFQYAEDIKMAMLDQISAAVTLCEERAKAKTITSVNTIKSLGILHLGDGYSDLTFNSDKMFRGRRDILAREVDFEVELADFFDISGLWERQEKVAGTGMALTVASVVGGRMMGGFGWVDGALSAVKVIGTKSMRSMIVPGIVATGVSPLFPHTPTRLYGSCLQQLTHSVLLTSAYLLHSIPQTLPCRLSRRISTTLSHIDYTHTNSTRIAHEVRRILRYPAETLRSGLQQSVQELGEKREDKRKVKKESEVARKYFGNLVRETGEGRARVEDVDLEGNGPGVAGAYEPGRMI